MCATHRRCEGINHASIWIVRLYRDFVGTCTIKVLDHCGLLAAGVSITVEREAAGSSEEFESLLFGFDERTASTSDLSTRPNEFDCGRSIDP